MPPGCNLSRYGTAGNARSCPSSEALPPACRRARRAGAELVGGIVSHLRRRCTITSLELAHAFADCFDDPCASKPITTPGMRNPLAMMVSAKFSPTAVCRSLTSPWPGSGTGLSSHAWRRAGPAYLDNVSSMFRWREGSGGLRGLEAVSGCSNIGCVLWANRLSRRAGGSTSTRVVPGGSRGPPPPDPQ